SSMAPRGGFGDPDGGEGDDDGVAEEAKGVGIAPELHEVVDRERERHRAAGDAARDENGRAEFADRAREREEHSGDDAARRERQRDDRPVVHCTLKGWTMKRCFSKIRIATGDFTNARNLRAASGCSAFFISANGYEIRGPSDTMKRGMCGTGSTSVR